jgi:hypothetical protein
VPAWLPFVNGGIGLAGFGAFAGFGAASLVVDAVFAVATGVVLLVR